MSSRERGGKSEIRNRRGESRRLGRVQFYSDLKKRSGAVRRGRGVEGVCMCGGGVVVGTQPIGISPEVSGHLGSSMIDQTRGFN